MTPGAPILDLRVFDRDTAARSRNYSLRAHHLVIGDLGLVAKKRQQVPSRR